MSLQDLNKIVESGIKLTPMMEQYYNIKKEFPDTLLLFRMGDFYEVFFEDAKTTAKLLNITLTHRGKIGDTPIPMAGIPHHAAATYIDRITNLGLKVAICEQVQNPKDAEGIVKRAVTQVVSPGIPFDLEKGTTNEHRYILSSYIENGFYYLVSLDFTTGDFKAYKLSDEEEFIETIRLLSPKEFITYMGQFRETQLEKKLDTLFSHLEILKTHLSIDYFDPKFASIYIEKLIPGFKKDRTVQSEKTVLNPIGALAFYVSSTQKLESFIHIRPFKLVHSGGQMKITAPTLIGLEILPKSRETYRESLLGFFDKTETAMGGRQLKTIFSTPLFNLVEIKKRQSIVKSLLDNYSITQELKAELSKIRDIERILAKISMNKVTATDLINLSVAIFSYEKILALLKSLKINSGLDNESLKNLLSISEKIKDSLNDEIGASLEKGNLIKAGVNKTRDKLSKLHLNVGEALIDMENKLKEKTGILKLRIKSNNVAGFFIEVSKGASTKVPNYFERRQTLVNAERYTTPDLEELEKETISAKDKLEKLEREIFKDLITKVSEVSIKILEMSNHISEIDVFQSMAKVAHNENFCLPIIHENKKIIDIKEGFHPLIRSIIKDQFVHHDIRLDENKYFGLITGPNMAGKTTVMREVAIIQLLAQIGSFVPAKHAEITLCDFLFSRLGASDDILKGQSTFMVEMAETAEIIRHAGPQSLIILDEVGRGTSTYDGLSIAWALVEHFINETKSMTLFATHYHELIELVDQSKNAKNLTVETINHKGNVQFLYRLIEKGASQSFGIYVAKLAGLPHSILKRSEEILHGLEIGHSEKKAPEEKHQVHGNQLSFLDENVTVEIPEYLLGLEDSLTKMDISRMTPLDALIKLNELKKQIELQ